MKLISVLRVDVRSLTCPLLILVWVGGCVHVCECSGFGKCRPDKRDCLGDGGVRFYALEREVVPRANGGAFWRVFGVNERCMIGTCGWWRPRTLHLERMLLRKHFLFFNVENYFSLDLIEDAIIYTLILTSLLPDNARSVG